MELKSPGRKLALCRGDDDELLCRPELSRGKSEAILLTADSLVKIRSCTETMIWSTAPKKRKTKELRL